MRFAIAAILVSCVACGSGGSQAGSGVSAAYKRDLDNMCHAEERSGALDQDESTRQTLVATWLASTIQTQEARAFLAELAKAPSGEKGALIAKEAKRVGVEPCPLASVWK